MPFRRDDDDVSFVLDQHAKFNLSFVLAYPYIKPQVVMHGVKPPTCLCLSQATTWISNIIYRGLFVFSEWKWEVIVRFVDIGEIIDSKYQLQSWSNDIQIHGEHGK